jgi:hypothetical protein
VSDHGLPADQEINGPDAEQPAQFDPIGQHEGENSPSREICAQADRARDVCGVATPVAAALT